MAKRKSKNNHNKKLGDKGELAAIRFLEKHGYEILERNWTCSGGEADIIVQDADTLVFVEVKTRSNCDNGLPEESVTAKKRKKYENIAIAYLKNHDICEVSVRFDVISILAMGTERAILRHHVNAFGIGE